MKNFLFLAIALNSIVQEAISNPKNLNIIIYAMIIIVILIISFTLFKK